MNEILAFGAAVASLSLCFIIMVILNWRQSDQIKSLDKRIKRIEDDRKESKGSVLFTRPIHIVPTNDYGVPVSRRERRRAGLMDGSGERPLPPENPPDPTVGGGK